MKQMIRELGMVILLGGFGGFIRTLVGKKRGEPYNLRIGMAEILIAVFAGLLVHWLCREYVQYDNLRTAAIALAGYSARGIMAILDAAVISRCKALAKLFGRIGVLLFTAILAVVAGGCDGPGHPVLREETDVGLIRVCRTYHR